MHWYSNEKWWKVGWNFLINGNNFLYKYSNKSGWYVMFLFSSFSTIFLPILCSEYFYHIFLLSITFPCYLSSYLQRPWCSPLPWVQYVIRNHWLLVLISLYILWTSIAGWFQQSPCHLHIFLFFHITLHIMTGATCRNHIFTPPLLYSNTSHWNHTPAHAPVEFIPSWTHPRCSQVRHKFPEHAFCLVL